MRKLAERAREGRAREQEGGREGGREGGKWREKCTRRAVRRNPCHILVGENPYSCWSWSKHAIQASARARLCIRIIQSRQRTAELYTRNVQQRVKLHCLFRVLSLHRPTSSPVLISNHASIMPRSISS